ncbi:hypothetical protein PATA110616_00360 [Paenibacillus tarimensis]
MNRSVFDLVPSPNFLLRIGRKKTYFVRILGTKDVLHLSKNCFKLLKRFVLKVVRHLYKTLDFRHMSGVYSPKLVPGNKVYRSKYWVDFGTIFTDLILLVPSNVNFHFSILTL